MKAAHPEKERKTLEKALKAALQEMIDASLYEHEAGLFRTKIVDGDHIGDTFKRFADEEALHKEVFKQIVVEISGKEPSLAKPERPSPSFSLRECLKTHVEMELNSIRMYEEVLGYALSPKHALLIKGIIADEMNHLKMLIRYIKHLKGP